ncbi:TetR/AcrR family transcriptional regulator [Enterococcus faecium]|nr:TetR/AcrR family transcriptional regulator [Enterococcus faecium]PWS25630.1 TetR/AcrR family transcriptional regulator [Enterococcus faecium]
MRRKENKLPTKPVLSEQEKYQLKQDLEHLCERYWINNGYKKTSIRALCQEAKISIGTFYTLYPTKEMLFFNVLNKIQKRLSECFLECIEENKSKAGFARALQAMLVEYLDKPFLYDTTSEDFRLFKSKLTPKMIHQLEFDNFHLFRRGIVLAGLRLKKEENFAFSVYNTLFSSIKAKETISSSYNYLPVLNFMITEMTNILFD